MATFRELMDAAKNADAAGDEAGARRLIELAKQTPQYDPRFKPEPMRGGTPEQQEQQLQEIAENIYGESGRTLDIRTGAPLSNRLVMSFAPTEKDKEQYLKTVYGNENVSRRGPDGRLVFTATDAKSGMMTDYFADELGLSYKDMSDIAGSAPEVLTSIATAFKVAPKSPNTMAGFAAVAAISELAGQTLGAIQDVGFKASQGTLNQESATEIAKRRGINTAIGTAAGTFLPLPVNEALKVVRNIPRFTNNPLAARGTALQQIASEGLQAAKKLENSLNQEILTSAAQDTGSKGLAQMEAYAERVSSMSNPNEALQLSRERVPITLQSLLLEGLEDPGIFGQQVSSRLADVERSFVNRGRAQIDTSYNTVLTRLESEIGNLTSPSIGVVETGKSVRGSLVSKIATDKAQSEILYNQVDELLLEANAPKEFVRWKNTLKAVNNAISDLPKTTTITEEVSPLVDAYGRAIKTDKTTVNPINLYTDAYSYFGDIIKASSSTQSLRASRVARTDMLDALRSDSRFAEGISKKHLSEISSALTKDIDDSLNYISGPAVKALADANNFYRVNVGIFEENPIINKVLNDPKDGGYAVEDIAGQFASGRGGLTELISIKKAIPPQVYAQLRRGIIDNIENGASKTYQGQEFIEPTVLSRRLDEMSPEFKSELFGSREGAKRVQSLLSEVNALDNLTPKLARPSGLTASDISEVVNAADNASFVLSKRNISRAIALEKQRTRTFQNNVLSANGDVLEVLLRDGERFINDFILSNSSPGQVKKVLGRLTPQQRQQIGSQTINVLFKRSQDLIESTVSSIKSPAKPGAISGDKILSDLYGPQRTVLKDLIAPEQLDILDNWLIYNHSLQSIVRAGGTVGVFSRDLAFGNPMKVAAQNLYGALVFSAPAQQFLRAVVRNPSQASKLGNFIESAGKAKSASGGLVALGAATPKTTEGLLDLYQKWELMTQDLSQAEKDLLLATYIPFSGTGKPTKSR
jgi:hypothetical protein